MTEAALQRRFRPNKETGTAKIERYSASLAVLTDAREFESLCYLLLFFYLCIGGIRMTVVMPMKAYEYVVVDLTILQES